MSYFVASMQILKGKMVFLCSSVTFTLQFNF